MSPVAVPLDRAPLADELDIAIIGAGIGGLAAAVGLCQKGFKPTIYEAAKQIAEVGAGIQVAPNFCRVLAGFGVLDHLTKRAVRLDRNSVRRYANNKQLGTTSFASLEERFGYPTFVVHRGDLHTSLLERAIELGAVLKVDSWVQELDFEQTRVKVKGEWHSHDLIIGGDGIKSPIRKAMMSRKGEVDETIDTGEAAYRVVLSRKLMEDDPELKELVDEPVAIRWMGPDAHIVAYPIKAHEAYNIVTTHITDRHDLTEDWTAQANKKQMQERFANYAPIVTKLFELAPEGDLVEWVLRIHEPLSHWVDGNVALMGDAAHATLPHIAQGAAMAGEDGAVLATVLGALTSKANIHQALLTYERLRKPRADWAVEQARITGHNLHVPDGPEQEARDKMIGEHTTQKEGVSNPDKWSDRDTQSRLYGYDVVGEAEKELAGL